MGEAKPSLAWEDEPASRGSQVVAALMLLRKLWHKSLVDMQTLRTLPSRAELRRFFAFGAFIIVLLRVC